MFGCMAAALVAMAPPAGIAVLLEGGYNLTSIAQDAEAVVRALLSGARKAQQQSTSLALVPPQLPLPSHVHSGALKAFAAVVSAHAAVGRWHCLFALHERKALEPALPTARHHSGGDHSPVGEATGAAAAAAAAAGEPWLPRGATVVFRQRIGDVRALLDYPGPTAAPATCSTSAVDVLGRVVPLILGLDSPFVAAKSAPTSPQHHTRR
jgi:hypothetical protein